MNNKEMNKQKMNNHHITIIGAGLVGSLLALVLARKGYTVDVYEARQDMRNANISAGRSINLALANRGIKPFKNPRINGRIKPAAYSNERPYGSPRKRSV